MQTLFLLEQGERRVPGKGDDHPVGLGAVSVTLVEHRVPHAASLGPPAVHAAETLCEPIARFCGGASFGTGLDQQERLVRSTLTDVAAGVIEQVQLLCQSRDQIARQPSVLSVTDVLEALEQGAGAAHARVDPVEVLGLVEDGEALG